MVKLLFDTNILIDYLSGVPQAQILIDSAYRPMISVVTYLEILMGATDDAQVHILRQWMAQFEMVHVSVQIRQAADQLASRRTIKRPSAIIGVSAQQVGATLITRNTYDFTDDDLCMCMPYYL